MSVIHIEAVAPTAREMRAIRRGWGGLHWVCLLPRYAFVMGFATFGLMVEGTAPAGLFGTVVIISGLVWWGGLQLTQIVAARAQRKSPTGVLTWAWTIDDQAMTFDNGLQLTRVDWRAVKSVTEDGDRFVFLVTPGYNPVLPKRLLDASQLAALKALIAEVTGSGRLGAGLDESRPGHA